MEEQGVECVAVGVVVPLGGIAQTEWDEESWEELSDCFGGGGRG